MGTQRRERGVGLSEKTRAWLRRNGPQSLAGKTVLITGANSGVGFSMAEIMAALGAGVIMACRNADRAEQARDLLLEAYPGARISVMALDLADLSSVEAFARQLRETSVDVDAFVNNAGVFHQPGRLTAEGIDLVLGTNYIGVYALTGLVLPYLEGLGHPVWYVNTISIAHKAGRIDYRDFYGGGRGHSFAVYARSKLCLARWSCWLAERCADSNVRVVMNHPGITITPLAVKAFGPGVGRLARMAAPLFNATEKSALSLAWIFAHGAAPGSIIGPAKGFGGWGYPEENRVLRKVRTGAPELIAFTDAEVQRLRPSLLSQQAAPDL